MHRNIRWNMVVHPIFGHAEVMTVNATALSDLIACNYGLALWRFPGALELKS
jgi:hypothetical protein